MEVERRFFRWFRKFLLRQLQAEWKRMAKWYKLDDQEFRKTGRWNGILNALDENSPLAKNTYKEVINWYSYGMDYLRAYVLAKRDDRSAKQS